MNKTLLLLGLSLLLLVGLVSATDYYFNSTGGSDANNCTTPALACQSITKSNTLSYVAGDVAYFNGVFRLPEDAYPNLDNGNASANVTYAGYGGRPVLLGSYDGACVGCWSNASTGDPDVWLFNLTFPNPSYDDVGVIYLNNASVFGTRKINSVSNLTVQDDFYYNTSTRRLYYFSVGNPASVYSEVELAWNTAMVDFRWLPSSYAGNRYVEFTGFELKYGGRHALYVSGSSGAHHIYIHNNTVSFIGGGYCGGCGGPLEYRWGNGVEVWNPASYVYVWNNTLSQVWDAGLTTQGDGALNNNNTYFWNNTVYNSSYCWEFFSNHASSVVANVSFTQNTCVAIGGMWGTSERIDSSAPKGWRLGSVRGNATGVVVEDNIFDVASGFRWLTSMPEASGWWKDNASLLVRNNAYSGNSTGFYWEQNVSYSNLSSFQSGTGLEVGSVEGLVVFNTSFTPVSSSFVCNMSTSASFVGAWACAVASVVAPVVSAVSSCSAGEVLLLGVVFLVFLVGLVFLLATMGDNLALSVLLSVLLGAVFLVFLLPVIKALLVGVC